MDTVTRQPCGFNCLVSVVRKCGVKKRERREQVDASGGNLWLK